MMRGWSSAAESQLWLALNGADDSPAGEWVRMLAATGLASLYFWQGRGDDTVKAARRALGGDRHHPALARLARQFQAVAALHTAGPAAAMDELQRVLSLPPTANSAMPHQADGLAWRSSLQGLLGQFRGAIDDARGVMRFIQEGSVAEVDVNPEYSLAWAHYLLGQWDEAVINAEHALSIAIAEGKAWAYARVHMIMTLVAAGRGDWKAASASAVEADRWVHTLGPAEYTVFPVMAEAAIAQARGDRVGMAKIIAPLIEFDRSGGWPLAYEPWWRVLQAEGLIGVGQLRAAREAVGRVEEDAARMPVLEYAAARLSGQLAEAEGNDQGAREIFDAALAVTPGKDAIPLHRAMLEEAYGRLLVRTHERRSGINWLKAAHQRYLALGARPFAERCAQGFGFATVPQGDQEDEGGPLAALTERERSVAHLVARGLTSQEVAARLFLSSKTVGYHLGHIYEKLGVASRRELRELLASTGLDI
jgi:ATP/maltotriose-dependent transcriptional regulator MalT